MRSNGRNLKWTMRMISIILIAGVADVLVVLFARRPFPWVVIIPAFVPLLISVFVIIPKIKADEPARSGV